jgi:hypothetical protein
MNNGQDSISHYLKEATRPYDQDEADAIEDEVEDEERIFMEVPMSTVAEQEDDLSLYKTAIFTKETAKDAIKTTLNANKPIRLSLSPPYTNNCNNIQIFNSSMHSMVFYFYLFYFFFSLLFIET